MGAKLIIIKSHSCSMPIYLIQTLNPTLEVCDRLDEHINKFFWVSSLNSKKIHMSNWMACVGFFKEGCMGYKPISFLIKGFSYKLWWKFRNNDSLSANFMNKKYCKIKHPIIWRRVCNIKWLLSFLAR
ncbi:hypothetical protein KFK09_019433 [Dendrobium nobile]|uniref:Reverse transcriptase zinc-binding domain-containing protein n=1 Tax=Dendrobium nobile TaxID=94219 RepID=A0A8T3AWQ0_DENNO|nr:hypothetical protein KFK09_019433 [Dendrobium nobile]